MTATIKNTLQKLVALTALGMLVTACAPQSAFNDIYSSSSASASTVSPTAITKMNYGF